MMVVVVGYSRRSSAAAMSCGRPVPYQNAAAFQV